MKALYRSLWLSSVAIAALVMSQAVNADWIEEKQDAGCISYKWYSFPNDVPAIKKNLYRYSWSGQCNSGEAISGKGTLTTLVVGSPDWWAKEEGEFKQGVRVGLFLIRSSNYPEPLRVNHKNGCTSSDVDCTPKAVSNQKSQSSQSQKTRGGKDNPEAQAHECIAIDQTSAGSFGGFKNSCNYKVEFSTCNYKPRITQGGFNWSADFDCEKGEFGLHTPGAGASVAAHNRNTEQVHWFACKAPASPTDIKFIVGKGLEGRCVNY